MSTALRSLFATFDVNTDGAARKLAALNEAVGMVGGALGELAKTALAAFSAERLHSFLDGMIDLGGELNDTAERLGVSTDALQRFQYAAGLSGVSADEAGRALQFLNKNLGDAIGGSAEQAKMFKELGISLDGVKDGTTSATDILPTLATQFEGMSSDAERTAKAMQIFGKGGAALLPMLKQGSAELLKLNAQFDAFSLGVSEDFVKKADDAGDAIDTLKLGFRSLKTRIAVEVMPGITELAKKFSGWIAFAIKLTKQTHIVKEGWIAMSVAAVVAFAKVGIGWAKMLGLVSGKGGIIKNLIGLGWLGLIIAGIAALYLIVDDLFTLFTGGESVIGEVLDKLFGVGTTGQVIEYVKEKWNEMALAVAALEPLLVAFGQGLTAAFELAWPWLVRFGKWFAEDQVRQIKLWVVLIKAALRDIGWLLEKVGKGVEIAGKLTGKKHYEVAGSALNKVGAGLQFATSKAAIPDKSDRAMRVAEVHQSNRVHIEVKGGATNADTGRAVSNAVGGAFADQNQQAAAALYSGSEDD